MKKSLILFAAAALTLASCGSKTDKAAEGGDSTNTEVEVAAAEDGYNDFPWDFPKSIEMEMENGQYYLAPCTFYPSAVRDKKDLTQTSLTFYNEKFTEITDGMVNGKVPTSLCIPLPNGETAKKGDIVLTWWQSGSGMQRALVTDDSTPDSPKTVYLDLNYKGDGTGMAEKHEDQLKPNTIKVLTNGKLEPGAQVAVSEDGKWKDGTCINVADDKVLVKGFSSRIFAAKKSDVKVIPLVPEYKAGDNVSVISVDSYKDGYTVKKVDLSIGRVWVEKNGREEIKNILEVTNTL